MIQVSIRFEDMLNEAIQSILCLFVRNVQLAFDEENAAFIDLRDIREREALALYIKSINTMT